MWVELPYRCWQVPSSFSSGRRCKSFQRAERQSKHWLQMEGCVTIFPPLAFLTAGPSPFLLSHLALLSVLLYFFRLCRPSSLRLSGGTCNHVFRIRGWHTFTILFPKDARAENDLDDNFISSYCQHVSTIRLSATVYRGRSMFDTLLREYINLHWRDRTVDIFIDNVSCQREKISYQCKFSSTICVISLIYFNEHFKLIFYNRFKISRRCIYTETQFSLNFIAYSRCNYIWCQI